jgi:hypothetical protein
MNTPDIVLLGRRNASRAIAKAKGAATHKVMKSFFAMRASSGLTDKAQRPGARDATIATTTLPPSSLQRMVRLHFKIRSFELMFQPTNTALSPSI